MKINCLSFWAEPKNPAPDLIIQIQHNNRLLWNGAMNSPENFSINLHPDHTLHCLEFTLLGKSSKHTILNSQGQIQQDSVIKFQDFFVDSMPVSTILIPEFKYQHNNNGTSDFESASFFGVMGCNGTATLNFTTPVFDWLLEKI